ncbi:MAG: sporulation protein YunB [Bacilli bacterium]|nr:sporulation protein YunB [Bacilli bacterium]
MKRKVYLKKSNKKTNIRNIYFFLISITILGVFFMLDYFNDNISPKMILMTETIVDKINNIIINNCVAKNYFNSDTLTKLIDIQKNKNDEIINVDFNMAKLYEITNHISNNIINEVKDIDISHIDFVNESISKEKTVYLSIPSGVVTDNVLLYNLGPKIPIKVAYVGNLFTNIKTSIKDYGINNSLIEVYVVIDIQTQIVAPFIKEDNRNSYSLLVASTIIEGKIPSYYNGRLDFNSNLVMSSIN